MIRPCCGTPDDSRAPSPHARDCIAAGPPAAPTGGPYCIAASCPVRELHRYGITGCCGDPFTISPIGTIRGDDAVWDAAHRGHVLPLTGAWYCDDCDSPYCDLA